MIAMLAAALAGPSNLVHQGRALDAMGVPLNATLPIHVALYDTLDQEVYATSPTVTLQDGYYVVQLVGVPESAFATPLEIGVTVGGMDEFREPLDAVPFAAHATSLSGGAVNATEIRVNDTLVINSSGTFVGSGGGWGAEGTTIATTGLVTSWTKTQDISLPSAGTYLVISNFRIRQDGNAQAWVKAHLSWTDSTGHTTEDRMITERIAVTNTFHNYGGSVSWIITTDGPTTVGAWYLASQTGPYSWYNDVNGVPRPLAVRLY